MLKIPIELPIYWLSEDESKLEELGLNSEKQLNLFRNVFFYNIDSVRKHVSEDHPGTIIVSGQEEYITPIELKEVIRLITATIEASEIEL